MSENERRRKRFDREHRRPHHHSPAYEVITTEGKALAIIRPLDPALALKLVDEIPKGIPHEEAERRFHAILETQPYRFMGLAARATGGGAPAILDPKTLKRIGTIEPGDSFVDYETAKENAERIPD